MIKIKKEYYWNTDPLTILDEYNIPYDDTGVYFEGKKISFEQFWTDCVELV